MADKALGLLGLMRRANAVSIGEDNTGATVKAGKAKLLLLAQDASENAVRRAENFSAGRNVTVVTMPYSKQELSENLGLPGCSMAAVTDVGFADALMKILAGINSEKYSEAAEEISRRCAKAKKRKSEVQAHDRNKKVGKRRTNA